MTWKDQAHLPPPARRSSSQDPWETTASDDPWEPGPGLSRAGAEAWRRYAELLATDAVVLEEAS